MVELVKQDFEKNKMTFEKVKAEILIWLGLNVKVDHVGSTAIPDMVGKNIIDILVGATDSTQFEKFKMIISSKGFYASPNSANEIYQFFASKQGETGEGDVHIHLVIMGTVRYDEFLILRDYLLRHKEEAERYLNHKKELISSGVTDRKLYRATKSKYVSELIARAKKEVGYE